MTYRLLKGKLSYVAAVATLLAIWQIGAFFLPPYVLPGVLKTVPRFADLLSTGDFQAGVKMSFLKLWIGYPIALAAGALVGLISGLSQSFATYMRGIISIMQSIPPVTWVPFLFIIFGFGSTPVIIAIVIASFFPMALQVINATESVNRTHLEVARVLGASRWALVTKVYLPETLPSVISGAQVAFGNAWRTLIAGEMVGGTAIGLGWSISYAGEVADMAGVLVGIVTVAVCASIIDHLILGGIKRRLLRWQESASGGEVA